MLQRFFLLAGFVLLFAPLQAQAQRDEIVVGRVGDIEVTMTDVDDAWRSNDASNRMRMLQDLYDTRRRVLDIVVGEILIEREAIARGLSRDELLAQELPSRTPPVTDEEIALLYGQNQNAFGGRTLEQMKPEIRAFLEQQHTAGGNAIDRKMFRVDQLRSVAAGQHKLVLEQRHHGHAGQWVRCCQQGDIQGSVLQAAKQVSGLFFPDE